MRAGREAAFGRELGELLARQGLSQARAGARCGIDRSYIGRLLTGERRPTHEVVERICGALQATQRERFRLHVAAGYLPTGVQASWVRLGELLAESGMAKGRR
jgi:transcriptional regulator with XRE-family HTH domain